MNGAMNNFRECSDVLFFLFLLALTLTLSLRYTTVTM